MYSSALARRERRGIEAAEPIARVRQVVGRRALAEPLEVGARRDEVREIGVRRKLTRLLGGADGLLNCRWLYSCRARASGSSRPARTPAKPATTQTHQTFDNLSIVRAAKRQPEGNARASPKNGSRPSRHGPMVTHAMLCSKSLSINRLVGLVYPFATMPDVVAPRIVPREEHSVSRRDIDPDALKVLYRLRQYDHVAYLVGGSVRDLLLGRRPKDFDIGTSAHPYQVKKLFRNCWIIGRRFRLAHVKFGHEGHRGRDVPPAGRGRRRSRRATACRRPTRRRPKASN